jgi:hypothetical protein
MAMPPDVLRLALVFGLLLGLIYAIYQMGWQSGRWYERRQQRPRRGLARADQERWPITVIDRLAPKAGKKR